MCHLAQSALWLLSDLLYLVSYGYWSGTVLVLFWHWSGTVLALLLACSSACLSPKLAILAILVSLWPY